MSTPKVYLAGGINALSDSDARDWREAVKARLSNTLDPMRRDYRGREDESVDEIVLGDLTDIAECDIVLANCIRPSWGTAMEIHHAASLGKRVIAVIPEGQPVSPWLQYFTEVRRTFDEALRYIKGDSAVSPGCRDCGCSPCDCDPWSPRVDDEPNDGGFRE